MQRLLFPFALLLVLAGALVYFWPMAEAHPGNGVHGAGDTTDFSGSELNEAVEGRANKAVSGHADDGITRSERKPPPPELEVALPSGSKQPVMVGRILNEEGVVGKNLSIRALVRVQEINFDETKVHNLTTDGYGRFQLYLGKRYREGRTRIVTFEMRATKRKLRRTSVFDLSHPVPPGIHDLGDVVLTVPPVILEGQVVDPFGVGIEGASVRMERFNRTSNVHGERVFAEPYWEHLQKVRTNSDENGFFVLHGADEPGDFRIVLSHYQHEDVTKEVELHEPYLAIEMRRDFQVQGSVLLDPGVELGGIRITAYREVTESSPEPSIYDNNPEGYEYVDSINLFEDGNFLMSWLAEEQLTFIVRCDDISEDLFLLKDVPMRPKNDLMTLAPFDLRGKLGSAKLKVVSHDGQEMKNYEIATSPHGPWNKPYKSIISVVSKSMPLNLYLRAWGHRSIALEGIRGKKKVVMEAGITATIELSGASELPQNMQIFASFSLVPKSGNGEGIRQSYLDTGLHLGQPNSFLFPEEGTYALVLRVGQYAQPGAAVFEDYRDIPHFTVVDIETPQRFVIDIPPDQLASAIQRAQAKVAEQLSQDNND
jgi:hypothetical protein